MLDKDPKGEDLIDMNETCWAEGFEQFSETPLRELVLDLSTFQLGDTVEWKERHFIRVKK
ncbi:hypothetical protein I6N90_00165 [Paenibacillus sp. GSMTC-2017]|uniref:hypothetical protein n=1 Tax=Paenibacillus sp. GSMTC-2017 TaxID=2794350 RepID=UPI0018DA3465|nr:hypothetical protein [Paenibacillus sp. GSMTC-2017]MBH5316221.1 hypothetical protein [Paenibacillus sp. GSMTC-2017]